MSPYPLPGRLSGAWIGGAGGGVGWTAGAMGTAAAGAVGSGAGDDGAGGVAGVTGGVTLGGCRAGAFFVRACRVGDADRCAGAAGGRATLIGVTATRTIFKGVFRATFGAALTRGSAAAVATTKGATPRTRPGANGSMNGAAEGVSASAHNRADPITQATTTNTEASRRDPMPNMIAQAQDGRASAALFSGASATTCVAPSFEALAPPSRRSPRQPSRAAVEERLVEVGELRHEDRKPVFPGDH